MTKIERIKEELKLNKELDSSLKLIVDFSIKNRTLIFSPEINDINVKLLHSQNVLKKNRVGDNLKFAFQFYTKYTEVKNFELDENFNSYSQSIMQIEKDFCDNKHITGFSNLKRELYAIAILKANADYGETFLDYIKSLDVETCEDEQHSFFGGYCIAAPFVRIDIEPFYYNAQHLIGWTKVESNYHLPQGRLLNGIRNRINEDSSYGMKCLKYVLGLKNFEIDFLIPIVTGLYEKNGISFYNESLETLIFDDRYSIPIICGLANIKSIGDDEAKLFLSIHKKVSKLNIDNLIYSSRLLFAILNSPNLSTELDYQNQCAKYLEEMVMVDNPNLIRYVLRESEYVENQANALQMLVVKLISQPHFQVEEYLRLIDHILWSTKEIEFFKQVLFALAENCKFKEVAKKLNSSIHEFIEKQKKEFDRLLINLLIQNKPYYRFVGFDIYNSITPLDGCYVFDFDILSLKPINQYKLWVSILVGYREPKSAIPSLLPLLNSKSSFVKEAFICKLEEYSENYGGGLTEVLKDKLDFNDTESRIVYERVEKYMNDFFIVNVKVKNDIKELNPQYSQNKIFKDFNKGYARSMGKLMQKASDDGNSFLNLITKVQLLKGGGWKMEGRDDISKLAEISSSYSLPRRCFIEPEHFDWEQSKELTRDWDGNYFDEIKNILDNE
ncbi:hypothetical protein [uncultured Draconibacterium sp.]|uniref:hypothetical protein n=1 Tax=uncultured Draconibacterium sp. TaxID=1573823 RepID=UPI003216B3BD